MQKILSVTLFLDRVSCVASKLSMLGLWVLSVLIFALAIALNFSYVNSKLDDFGLYCFALLVLFAIAQTLKENKHVRVDLLYAHYTQKTKIISWLLINILLILPFSLVLVKYGLDFTIQSYTIGESSPNGKIPHYFIFKALVVLGFMLLGLQSIAEALKAFVKLKEKSYTMPQDMCAEESINTHSKALK